MAENAYKVRLVSVADEAERVVFNVAPTFSENRSVNYQDVAPVHMPGSIQVYRGTSSRSFSVGGTFVSRTSAEAYDNMVMLQRLRSWTLPYFGKSSTVDQTRMEQARNSANAQAVKLDKVNGNLTNEQKNAYNRDLVANGGYELLGAPPMVLYLYAYSTESNKTRRNAGRVNINRVPVVMTQLDFQYPNDVDYIPAFRSVDVEAEPFPVKMEVTITLLETHSPREYEQFNIADFRAGRMVNF